jgi:hypothetical protein
MAVINTDVLGGSVEVGHLVDVCWEPRLLCVGVLKMERSERMAARERSVRPRGAPAI